MKFLVALVAAFALLVPSSALFAQSRAPMDAAREQVFHEDAAVRVVRVSVPPHQETTLSGHANAELITLPAPAGGAVAVSGVTSRTGTVENVGDNPQDLVIVDFKAAPTAPSKAVVGASPAAPRPGLEIRTLFDNEHVLVDLYRLSPGYRDPREHPHQWETIIVHVANNDMEGAGAGSVRRQVAIGDVAVIPANVNHAFANLGTAPAEFLYVRVR